MTDVEIKSGSPQNTLVGASHYWLKFSLFDYAAISAVLGHLE
jgi:hypothetical protein